jgi:thioredoxin 1
MYQYNNVTVYQYFGIVKFNCYTGRLLDCYIVYFFLKNKLMYTELTEDTLQNIVNDNEKVVVQYGATWCGNCRIMKPKFKKLAAENDAIPFLYVDAEKLPESRKLAKVDNLPTFAIFKNGELVNQVQSNQAESLINLFNEL